jgi:hypothetical protein
MARKNRTKAHSTNILDYHSNLSMSDKEELVARAKLKAERENEKPKPAKPVILSITCLLFLVEVDEYGGVFFRNSLPGWPTLAFRLAAVITIGGCPSLRDFRRGAAVLIASEQLVVRKC